MTSPRDGIPTEEEYSTVDRHLADCGGGRGGAEIGFAILLLAREVRALREHLAKVTTPPTCRECGCADDRACLGGCHWIEPDLCSTCAPAVATECSGDPCPDTCPTCTNPNLIELWCSDCRSYAAQDADNAGEKGARQ